MGDKTSGLTSNSANIALLQDQELANAISSMSKEGGGAGLKNYLQQAQDNLYSGITETKDSVLMKAYGDLERASSVHNSLYYYDLRNTDLDNIQSSIYTAQKEDTDAILHDRDLAKRQYEINQWTAGDGMDTLFVYQQLLIIVCTVIVLLFLWRQSILSDLMFFGILFVLVCIFVFTIVNRAQYTKFIRDKRFWNRRLFPTYKGIPLNICGDKTVDTQAMEDSLSKTVDDAADGLNNAMNNLEDEFEQGKEAAKGAWDDFRETIGM
jgi:hypothetical protein